MNLRYLKWRACFSHCTYIFLRHNFKNCSFFAFCIKYIVKAPFWCFKKLYYPFLAMSFFSWLSLISNSSNFILANGFSREWWQHLLCLGTRMSSPDGKSWAVHCHSQYEMESSLSKNTHGERKHSFIFNMGINQKRNVFLQVGSLLKSVNKQKKINKYANLHMKQVHVTRRKCAEKTPSWLACCRTLP